MPNLLRVESNAVAMGVNGTSITTNRFTNQWEAHFNKDVRIAGPLVHSGSHVIRNELNYNHTSVDRADQIYSRDAIIYNKVGCQCYIHGYTNSGIYQGRSEATKLFKLSPVMTPSHDITWIAGNVNNNPSNWTEESGAIAILRIDTEGWLSILWMCENNTATQYYGAYNADNRRAIAVDICYCVDDPTPLTDSNIITVDSGIYVLYDNGWENEATPWTAKNTSVYSHPNTYSYSTNSKAVGSLMIGCGGGSSTQYGWFYTPTLTVPNDATKLVMSGYTTVADMTLYLGLNQPSAGRQFNNFINGGTSALYRVGANRNVAVSYEVDVSAYRGNSNYGVVVGASHSGSGSFYCKKIWFEP